MLEFTVYNAYTDILVIILLATHLLYMGKDMGIRSDLWWLLVWPTEVAYPFMCQALFARFTTIICLGI